MAFTFGAGNNNQGPAPAPAPTPGGGFSFGTPAPVGGAAPAASTAPSFGNASTPAAAPAGGFSFSGAAAAPAAAGTNPPAPAAAPSTPGFAFGNTPAPAPSGAPAPGAPAPSGFSFGTPAPATASAPGAPAPTPNPTAASAPAPVPATSGFSFGAAPAPAGSSAPAPGAPAPATTGFSLGGTLTTPATPGAPATALDQPTLDAPEYDSVFRNLELWSKIKKLCSQETMIAGQELIHYVRSNANELKPKVLDWTQPNQSIRQQLLAKPVVSINKGPTSQLNKKTLERIVDLSTDLHISEANATTLYARVSADLEAIQSIPMTNLVEQGMGPDKKYAITTKLAREFYFYERHLRLQTLLFMMQSRLKENKNADAVLQVTDVLLENGLVTDLIQVIRDYTLRVQQLQTEIASSKPQLPMYANPAQPPPPQQPPRPNFRKVHLLFANQERALACECLFFIAYHTQLTSSEMTGLLDLIKDLSTLAPIASPFNNVPAPYEPATTPAAIPTAAPWPTPSSSSAPLSFSYALKEKDPLVWQRELVTTAFETGVPQVLQCISLLVVAATAAMDSRQILHDRKLHGPNAFGRGNAFLPPDDLSLDGIRELHSRLNPDAMSNWAREDIWGVLAASYALLLRSAPTLLSSPRAGGATQLSSDVRQAARICLEMPVDKKAFTFSRMTLLPILQRLPTPLPVFLDPSEFGLSVYSDFYAHYLNVLTEGQLPSSRRRWEKDQDEELQLRRAQQAQAQQFRAAMGASFKEEVIPVSVDLSERPDCLDDIIALATTICSLGRDYSWKFWAQRPDGTLLPSRVLLDLERLQKKDESLLPSYISLLAALANDEASADAVHVILSRTAEAVADSVATTSPINWTTLIFNLRWYAQELSPYDADVVSKPATTSTTTTSTKNSDYYYNLDGRNVPLTLTTSTTSTVTQGQTTSTSTSSKAKELSALSSYRVASHLAVIMNVALHSSAAQHAILSTSIPISEGPVSGSDEALLVLFKLAIAPLSPQLRGATLGTIASLLRPPAMEDKEKENLVREQAKHAWEYLESCPLLPIALLDQYRVVNGSAADIRANTGLAFPPTSISLANSTTLESVLPKDQNYGLIYAMEHIEARMGWYPSIEGFLQMLQSLVCTAGCPSKLGHNWRLRSGCSPYLEFVVNFILPRSLGLRGLPPLPFRVFGDRSRLVSHAMSVVEAVVSRYSVPCKALKVKEGASSQSLLGMKTVADSVSIQNASIDNQEAAEDFKNRSLSSYNAPEVSDGASTAIIPSHSSAQDIKIPSTKSPGFMILADILSSAGGVIFQAIGTILTEHGGSDGIGLYGLQSDRMEAAYAMFGATPPDLSSAKEGVKQGNTSAQLQSLLKPLAPCTQKAILDPNKLDDAVHWRENSIVISLRILCAAAIREEAFVTAVSSSKVPLKIVPVLRFQNIRFGSANLRSSDVLLSRLPRQLFSMQHSDLIRKSLVQCIGSIASSENQSPSLSATATSLFYYLHQSMAPGYTLRELCGNEAETFLAKSIAQRLVVSSKLSNVASDSETTAFILNWILSDLRAGTVSNDGLIQVLLGLPSETSEGNWKPGSRKYSFAIADCFDAILEILSDTDSGGAGVAASCFEVIFRLYDLRKTDTNLSLRVAVYTAERLRSEDFWLSNTLIWLSSRGSSPLSNVVHSNVTGTNPDALHCVSWLLKGLACEIQLLAGFTSPRNTEERSVMSQLLAPRPIKCNSLLSLLFGSDEAIARRLVELAPLERMCIDSRLLHPPIEALRSAVSALQGAPDVIAGYEQLDSKKVLKGLTSRFSADDLESMCLWSEEYNSMSSWNCAVAHLCQAFYIVIDASLCSSEALRLSGATSLGADAVGLQTNSIASLMMLILRRINADSSGAAHLGMDSSLLPVATCSLSNAVLILAETMTRLHEDEAPDTGQLLLVASSLSTALAFSAKGEESADEAPTRYERTAVLGSALSVLLRSTRASEPDIIRQYRDEFVETVHALEKLACFQVDSTSSESLGVVAVLARTTIGGIVSACSDETDAYETSFVLHAVSKRFISSLLQLTANLDDHVGALLQTIALQPFGANILLDAGICRSLQAAAKTYAAEEKRVSVQLGREGTEYNKNTIRTPSFLLSHLKLMSALLASPSLSERQGSALALDLLGTFAIYKHVIERLCNSFPVEADVLRWFLRCLVQSASLSQPVNSHGRHDELLGNSASKAKRIFSESRFLENGVAMLCEQLWENPLPRQLLAEIPHSLHEPARQPQSSLVAVEKSNSQTWWNVLDHVLLAETAQNRREFEAPAGRNDFGYWSQPKTTKWTETKFEYSIAAMDVLSLGITLLKRMNRFDLIDGLSAARGLFYCARAAESVESRLEEVRISSENGGSMMGIYYDEASANAELEKEYLSLLGVSMARCVEELIVVTYQLAAEAKENGKGGMGGAIRIAIENSGIESKGVGCLSLARDAQSRQKLASNLCGRIKKETKA